MKESGRKPHMYGKCREYWCTLGLEDGEDCAKTGVISKRDPTAYQKGEALNR